MVLLVKFRLVSRHSFLQLGGDYLCNAHSYHSGVMLEQQVLDVLGRKRAALMVCYCWVSSEQNCTRSLWMPVASFVWCMALWSWLVAGG
jgi:hypothetical protein